MAGIHACPPLRATLLLLGTVQLKDYMGHGGLVVNWQVFGSGGLKVRSRAWGCCWRRRGPVVADVQQQPAEQQLVTAPGILTNKRPAPSHCPAAAAQGQLNDVLLAV